VQLNAEEQAMRARERGERISALAALLDVNILSGVR